MEIKKTPVQIPLTWLHVWLLFAGIYGFAAGFLELKGREALYFCAISLLLLIPAGKRKHSGSFCLAELRSAR